MATLKYIFFDKTDPNLTVEGSILSEGTYYYDIFGNIIFLEIPLNNEAWQYTISFDGTVYTPVYDPNAIDPTYTTIIYPSTTEMTEGTNLFYTDQRFDDRLATKTTTNLAEGTNLYYTTARANTDFDNRLATKTTTNLAEGTNLYYTTVRANTDFDTRLATKTTTNLPEGTNLYYTDARFDTRLATKTTDNLTESATKKYSQFTTSGSTIYYNTGNVGIGTNNPSNKLEVIGTTKLDGTVNISGQTIINYPTNQYDVNLQFTHDSIYLSGTNPPNPDLYITVQGSGKMKFSQNSLERFRIENSGLLNAYYGVAVSGLGTFNNGVVINNPTSPANMPTTALTVNNGASYMNGYDVSGSITFSIKCASGIWNTGTYTETSDGRIKKNIVDVDDDSALQKIMSIEPKKYDYIDNNRGVSNVYGFIAQQIKDVIPEAVYIGKDYIPNIYDVGSCSSNIITLSSNVVPNNILTSNIKIIDNDGNENMCQVDGIISSNCFSINSNIDTSNVFVYGTEVNDFHTLNKSYIYTLNVCATQELKRQNDVLKSRVDYLENQLSTLMEHIDTTNIIWEFK